MGYWPSGRTASATPSILVPIGSGTGPDRRRFHWLPALLCLLFAALMQCTANLVNDLWDFMKGADKPDRLGPDRASSPKATSPFRP